MDRVEKKKKKKNSLVVEPVPHTQQHATTKECGFTLHAITDVVHPNVSRQRFQRILAKPQ